MSAPSKMAFASADKAALFRKLHEGPDAFVIPNPWDVGSARILAALGFRALATTSAGYAFSRGILDGRVERDEMLAHVRELVDATPLPVSADLENGFGDSPEAVAETIALAGEAGLCGCSIEDTARELFRPVYDFALAVERVKAAAEAKAKLPIPFTLTARAENFLVGIRDLDDTIRRLQAFQQAGADVLYAPGLVTREEIAAVVSSVDRPVNVIAGIGCPLGVRELSELGVRRISVGSVLARTAYGSLIHASRQILDEGRFDFAADAVPFVEITSMLL